MTPILISTRGNSLALTSKEEGVSFDLNADGLADQTAWTVAGSDDVFLVVDRNGNGLIDNGSELFGNSTPQPPAESPNGFLALAVYDDPANGGDGDGWITPDDAGFAALQVWRDANHDGVSQAGELQSLSATRIRKIGLDYRQSPRTDRHGNEFKYISTVQMDEHTPGPRRKFAVDVILVACAGQPE